LTVNVSPDFELDPAAPNEIFVPVGDGAYQGSVSPANIEICYAAGSPECATTPVSANGLCCTGPMPQPTEVPGSVLGVVDSFPDLPVVVLPSSHFAPFFPTTPALGPWGTIALASALVGLGVVGLGRKRTARLTE
jgi:hypothetical protein